MTSTTTPMNPDEKKAIEYCLDHDNFSTNELPVRTDVCHRCRGTGVTWGGIVLGQSDFDEDPYLHESIMNGSFDRPCEECNGNKVLQYVNWDNYDSFPKTHSLRLLREMLEDIWESRAMEAAERRAGC